MSIMIYKVTLKNGGTYRIRYLPRYAAVTVTPFYISSKRPTSSQKAEALTLQQLFDAIYDLGTSEETLLTVYLTTLMAAFIRVELIESVE